MNSELRDLGVSIRTKVEPIGVVGQNKRSAHTALQQLVRKV